MSNPGETVEVRQRQQKTRRLKMAYNISQTNGDKIAAVRFSGQYLEGLGFSADGYMDMTINDDQSITIRAISKEAHEAELRERANVKQ